MAAGVRDLLGADVGLGVTGVAGPESAEGHAPGTVYLGAVVGDADPVTAQVVLPGDRVARAAVRLHLAARHAAPAALRPPVGHVAALARSSRP